MALTWARTSDTPWVRSVGDEYEINWTCTFDSSYAIGGEAVTAAALGFSVFPRRVAFEDYPSYTFDVDRTNLKVRAYYQSRLGLLSNTVTLKHDASAATNGVAVYVHVDEVIEQGTVLAHLECVNAGNADSYFTPYSGGPKFSVQDDDNAATGGTALFYNEDDTAGLKFTTDFDRISGTDTSQSVVIMGEDGSFLRIFDQDNPSGETGTVQVYFDDDAANDYNRLLYVAPGTANTTDRMWGYGGEVPNGTNLSAVAPRVITRGKYLA